MYLCCPVSECGSHRDQSSNDCTDLETQRSNTRPLRSRWRLVSILLFFPHSKMLVNKCWEKRMTLICSEKNKGIKRYEIPWFRNTLELYFAALQIGRCIIAS